MLFWDEFDLTANPKGYREMHETRLGYSIRRRVYLSRTAAVRFLCSTLPIFPAGSAAPEMRRIYSLSLHVILRALKIQKEERPKSEKPATAREIGKKVVYRRSRKPSSRGQEC